MNIVILSGALSRAPELNLLASGQRVTRFTVVTYSYLNGEEEAEYTAVVAWDRLAEMCAQYLRHGDLVNVQGRLRTRGWEDDRKIKHYRTEVVADSVKLLSGINKDDFDAEAGAESFPKE